MYEETTEEWNRQAWALELLKGEKEPLPEFFQTQIQFGIAHTSICRWPSFYLKISSLLEKIRKLFKDAPVEGISLIFQGQLCAFYIFLVSTRTYL